MYTVRVTASLPALAADGAVLSQLKDLAVRLAARARSASVGVAPGTQGTDFELTATCDNDLGKARTLARTIAWRLCRWLVSKGVTDAEFCGDVIASIESAVAASEPLELEAAEQDVGE